MNIAAGNGDSGAGMMPVPPLPPPSMLLRLGLLLSLVWWPALCSAALPDCQPHPAILLAKIEARAVIVGELHGTAETPALVGQIVCGLLRLGRPVVLALERDGSEQEALNRYLASAGRPEDVRALLATGAWAHAVQDGRNSRAMLALIEQMREWRQAGQRVGVLAMQLDFTPVLPRGELDGRGLSPADIAEFSALNDRTMADKVWATLASYPAYTVVALAGNMHTALGSASRAALEAAPSFADLLARRVPVHIIGVGSHGGTGWFLTSTGMGAQPVTRGPLFRTDSRIDTRVDLGEVSASPPAAAPDPGEATPRPPSR